MLMHDMFKRKNMQRKIKSKKNENAFKYGCKRVSRRCGSYRMYLEGDSLYQTVMIVCELIDFIISQIIIICKYLYNLVIFFTHNMQNSILPMIHM